MGLTTKTVREADVYSNNIIEEIPKNWFINQIISGLLTGKDITSTIVSATLTSPSRAINDYYKYGERKYLYKLPDITYEYGTTKEDVAKRLIEEILGVPINMVALYYGIPPEEMWAKIHIITTYLSIDNGGIWVNLTQAIDFYTKNLLTFESTITEEVSGTIPVNVPKETYLNNVDVIISYSFDSTGQYLVSSLGYPTIPLSDVITYTTGRIVEVRATAPVELDITVPWLSPYCYKTATNAYCTWNDQSFLKNFSIDGSGNLVDGSGNIAISAAWISYVNTGGVTSITYNTYVVENQLVSGTLTTTTTRSYEYIRQYYSNNKLVAEVKSTERSNSVYDLPGVDPVDETTQIFEESSVVKVEMDMPPTNDWYIIVFSYATPTIEQENVAGVLKFDKEAVSELASFSVDVDDKIPPIALLRKNFQFINTNPSTEEYITTKKLLKELNLDLDELIKVVEEAKDEATSEPIDLSKIHGLYLFCGISINTVNKDSKEYLHKFFKVLADIAAGSAEEYSTLTQEYLNTARGILKIQEQTFKYSWIFSYVKKEVIQGSIGKKGTLVIDKNLANDDVSSLNYETGTFNIFYSDLIDDGYSAISQYDENGNIIEDAEKTTPPKLNSSIVSKKQISEYQYEQITIYGTIVLHTLPLTNNAPMGKPIKLDDANGNFLIPLSIEVLNELPIAKREAPIYEALNFIFQVAWQYKKKSFFGKLVGAFVGALLGAIGGAILSAMTTGAAFSVSSILNAGFLARVALSTVLNLVLSEINPKLAAIISIAISFAGTFFQQGTFKLDFSNLDLGDVLLKSLNIIQEVQKLGIMADFEALQKEEMEFLDQVKSYDEQLADYNQLLPDNLLDARFLQNSLAIQYTRDTGSWIEDKKKSNGITNISNSAASTYVSQQLNVWNTVDRKYIS